MRLLLLLFVFIAMTFHSCGNKSQSSQIASYKFSQKVKLNPELDTRVGSWIEEGMYCYGIVALEASPNTPAGKAKSIKVKVLVISSDEIKVKANETVSLAPKDFCNKMGVDKGDIWWEKEPHLFQTKEEADAFIKKYFKGTNKAKPSKFTVD